MKELNELLQQGKLSAAIELLVAQLRDNPTNLELRSSFIELLCVDGQLERADKQLDMLVRQHPQCLGGASSLRHLIRAAQARIDFAQGADTATLVSEADDAMSALVELRLIMQEGNSVDVQQQAEKIEALRSKTTLTINDNEVSDTRDIDDTLSGCLELFGTNGKFYLIPLAQVASLQLKPVTSISELVWRKVEIDIIDGPSGDAFLPMTYLGSATDAEKLGRETDWKVIEGTEVYQGVGQKMWLVGDDALTVGQLSSIKQVEQVTA